MNFPASTPENPVRLGDYEVHDLLGQGGMGAVYRARHREHGGWVALKTLTRFGPQSLLRFKQEFRSVAGLSHPNLVPLYELCCVDNLWFFTMELLAGAHFLDALRGVAGPATGSETTELRTAVVQTRTVPAREAGGREVSAPPSLPRVRDALAQLTRGVQALHDAGLVHLDLKPNNVMIDSDGRLRVLDFGLVQSLEGESPGDFQLWGTPLWMAPEQLLQGELGPPADWYAVGLMLYQALTGVAAFPSVDPTAKLHLPPAPHELVPGLPLDLSELTLDLLTPDPSRRPGGEELGVVGGAPAPQLIGRAAERARLEEALQRSRAGPFEVVCVSGPSGMGKSALLRTFLADCEVLTLRGRCYEHESVPYKALDGLVDQLSLNLPGNLAPPTGGSELARLFPVLLSVPSLAGLPGAEPLPAPELRRRAVEALSTMLAACAPVVALIDDLQWSDADSDALLELLLERRPPGVLLLLSSREPLPGALEIGPLSPTDAEELARVRLGPQAALAAAVAEESGGIPLFVEELAHFAREHGRLAEGGLEQVLARRVRELPSSERILTEIFAVAASPLQAALALEVAALPDGQAALWALRRQQLVRRTGEGFEIHHDRLRHAVLADLEPERKRELHLALGKAREAQPFEAFRHFRGVFPFLSAQDRPRAARVCLEAGRLAHLAATQDWGYTAFETGASLVGWEDDYELALALRAGAVEAAYRSGLWKEAGVLATLVRTQAHTVLDQLPGWEVAIGLHISRKEYAEAVDKGLEVLLALGFDLPADPGEALETTLRLLEPLGVEGFRNLPEGTDPHVSAAQRLCGLLGSATFFARPALFPILACRSVAASVEHGLSAGTPYGLAVFAVVLNSVGRRREGHAWGRLAQELLARFSDRRLAARTLHVVHDLACVWMVPLHETLDDLLAVVDLARRAGDLEYAGYAAHGYVHNAFYAGVELGLLSEEATRLGAFMREFQLDNAHHVHVPFEQAIRAFRGGLPDLNGADFDEELALESARQAGSRSAQAIIPLLMGIVRFHYGSRADARACLERARPFLDGLASTWHLPLFHQYAALCGAGYDEAYLRELADDHPPNFAHRLELARGHGEAAVEGARRGNFLPDLALALELAGRAEEAAEAYRAWGASRR